jgi:hypothetical protein
MEVDAQNGGRFPVLGRGPEGHPETRALHVNRQGNIPQSLGISIKDIDILNFEHNK